MNSKKLTVGYSCRYSSSRYCGSESTTHSKIVMEGKWLEDLGFHIGDKVNIEYEEGMIKISPAPEEVLMVAEPSNDYTSKKSSRRSARILK